MCPSGLLSLNTLGGSLSASESSTRDVYSIVSRENTPAREWKLTLRWRLLVILPKRVDPRAVGARRVVLCLIKE